MRPAAPPLLNLDESMLDTLILLYGEASVAPFNGPDRKPLVEMLATAVPALIVEIRALRGRMAAVIEDESRDSDLVYALRARLDETLAENERLEAALALVRGTA